LLLRCEFAHAASPSAFSFFVFLSGKRFHYKIKRCDSTVVADQFLYNHDDKLVVTLRQSHSNAPRTMRLRTRQLLRPIFWFLADNMICSCVFLPALMLSGQRLHAAHEEQEVNRTHLHPLSLRFSFLPAPAFVCALPFSLFRPFFCLPSRLTLIHTIASHF
jgi:hypothetical protein